MEYLSMHGIYVFKNVVEKNSFRAAAEAMGISQPAVSAHIRRLEEQFGLALFERSSKQAHHVLTPAGKIAYDYATRLLELNNTTEIMLEGLRSGQTGEISFALAIGKEFFTSIVSEYIQIYPQISMTFRAGSSTQVRDLVESGDVGFGLSHKTDDSTSLAYEKLYSEPMCLFCSSGHPLAKKQDLTVADLAAYDMIWCLPGSNHNRVVQNYLRSIGIPQREHLHVEDGTILLKVVAHGNGIGILTQSTLLPMAADGDITLLHPAGAGQFPYVQCHLVYRKTVPLSPASKLFIQYVKKRVQELNFTL